MLKSITKAAAASTMLLALSSGAGANDALAELGTKTALDRNTRLSRDGEHYRVNGRKFYATGALYAQRIPTLAVDEHGNGQLAFIPRQAAGLQVIDDDGLPPRVLRAGLRQAAGLLSWLSLNLGHALAAVPPRHQALHDRIAGIRVVRTDARPLRPAVRLWLALQLPACFLLLALLMRAVDRSLTLALDASWPL